MALRGLKAWFQVPVFRPVVAIHQRQSGGGRGCSPAPRKKASAHGIRALRTRSFAYRPERGAFDRGRDEVRSAHAIGADSRARRFALRLQPVAQSGHAFRLRAMRAAEHGALLFDAMPEDVGSTVRACGGNAVNGAFEAV